MTHSEIYTKFMIEYDKANVTSSYPSLTKFEIATLLDKAYLALIAQKLTGNNLRKVALEGDIKAVKDIEPLIVHKEFEESEDDLLAENEKVYKLGDDLLYYLYSNILYTTKPIKYKRGTTFPRKMLIGTKLVTHEYADNFRYSSINKPWIKNPVCYLEDNKLHVLYDSEKHYLTNTSSSFSTSYLFYTTYIKKPNSFVIDDYISTSYSVSDENKSITYNIYNDSTAKLNGYVTLTTTGTIITKYFNEDPISTDETITFNVDISSMVNNGINSISGIYNWNGIDIQYCISTYTDLKPKPSIVLIDAPSITCKDNVVTIISNANKTCDLIYTTDGTDPTTSNGTVVSDVKKDTSESFNITLTTTVKAMVYYKGTDSFDDPDLKSSITLETFVVDDYITLAPSITLVQNDDNTIVTITNPYDEGFYICYTVNGEDPTSSNWIVTSNKTTSIEITTNTTIKALTINSYLYDNEDYTRCSAITRYNATIKVKEEELDEENDEEIITAPTIRSSYDNGIYTIYITNDYSNGDNTYSIGYTIDGTDPTPDNCTIFTESFYITKGTVKAIVFNDDTKVYSNITESTFTILNKLNNPIFLNLNPNTNEVTVKLNLSSGGSYTAAYTLDGTVPTSDSSDNSSTIYRYVGGVGNFYIHITESCLIQLIIFLTDNPSILSAVVKRRYTLKPNNNETNV